MVKYQYTKTGERDNIYSMVHFERLFEKERGSEEIYVIQNDKIETYERKWENI